MRILFFLHCNFYTYIYQPSFSLSQITTELSLNTKIWFPFNSIDSMGSWTLGIMNTNPSSLRRKEICIGKLKRLQRPFLLFSLGNESLLLFCHWQNWYELKGNSASILYNGINESYVLWPPHNGGIVKIVNRFIPTIWKNSFSHISWNDKCKNSEHLGMLDPLPQCWFCKQAF